MGEAGNRILVPDLVLLLDFREAYDGSKWVVGLLLGVGELN